MHEVHSTADIDDLMKLTVEDLLQETNVLPTASRKFYSNSSSCGAGVDRRALTYLSSSTASFSMLSVLNGPLLPNWHCCGTVVMPLSCYCMIGKSFFSEADNTSPLKLLCFRNFCFFRHGDSLGSN